MFLFINVSSFIFPPRPTCQSYPCEKWSPWFFLRTLFPFLFNQLLNNVNRLLYFICFLYILFVIYSLLHILLGINSPSICKYVIVCFYSITDHLPLLFTFRPNYIWSRSFSSLVIEVHFYSLILVNCHCGQFLTFWSFLIDVSMHAF